MNAGKIMIMTGIHVGLIITLYKWKYWDLMCHAYSLWVSKWDWVYKDDPSLSPCPSFFVSLLKSLDSGVNVLFKINTKFRKL